MAEIDVSSYIDTINKLQNLKREFISIVNNITLYQNNISKGFLINNEVKFKSLDSLKTLIQDKKDKITNTIIPELYEELNR